MDDAFLNKSIRCSLIGIVFEYIYIYNYIHRTRGVSSD